MKILILGDSGRTHALVWKLFNSHRATSLVCMPGNGGTALLAPSAAPPAATGQGICQWAFSEGFQLLLPADPVYLQLALADEAQALRLAVFGAPRRSALLTGSRLWTKEFLLRHNLPTPRGRCFTDLRTAERHLAGQPLPVALWGDVPLAQEGIYYDRYLAMQALEHIFAAPLASGYARGVIIEEALLAPRVAFSALSDGQALLPLLPVRLYDELVPEEQQTSTLAPGAMSGNSAVTFQLARYLLQHVLEPLAKALSSQGLACAGLLGIDCVIGPQQPLISAVRHGWSQLEAQALLPRLDDDLLALIEACLAGQLAPLPALRWKPQASAVLGLVMEGYPAEGGEGEPISGLADLDPGILAFHSQTSTPYGLRYIAQQGVQPARSLFGSFTSEGSQMLFDRHAPPGAAGLDQLAGFSTGGREVLSLVALGDSLQQARQRLYANATRIQFYGRTFRPDIGEHEL